MILSGIQYAGFPPKTCGNDRNFQSELLKVFLVQDTSEFLVFSATAFLRERQIF